MFLGRSTPQWAGVIAATLALVQVIIVNVAPQFDPAVVATVLGSIGVALNGWIVFLANTATTPVKDPQLQVGTAVRVTDESGTVIGSSNVPSPTP